MNNQMIILVECGGRERDDEKKMYRGSERERERARPQGTRKNGARERERESGKRGKEEQWHLITRNGMRDNCNYAHVLCRQDR